MLLFIILSFFIFLCIGIIINIIIHNNNNKNKINKDFVINLPTRKERLELFKNNYNLNIPLTVTNAVNGYNLDIEQLYKNGILGIHGLNSINKNKNKERKYHYELTNKGSIGCYLSHYNIWITYKDFHICLIFEDDTIFNDISLNEIYYRISLLPKDWDIYLLSDPLYCYDFIDYEKNLLKVKRFFLTNAYVIKKEGIEKILNTNTIFPIQQQIDSYLSELAMDFNLNIYIHNHKYKCYKQNMIFGSDIQFENENQSNISFNRLRLI